MCKLSVYASTMVEGVSGWSGSVYIFTPIRVVDNLTAPLYVYSRLGEGTRCCEERVQEDIVVIDNKSLWCLLAGVYMNDL